MDCPFCDPPRDRVFYEDALVLGLWDAYPVSEGHALVITRRHVATWFDASADEQAAVAWRLRGRRSPNATPPTVSTLASMSTQLRAKPSSIFTYT
jgi:hypothetical protein